MRRGLWGPGSALIHDPHRSEGQGDTHACNTSHRRVCSGRHGRHPAESGARRSSRSDDVDRRFGLARCRRGSGASAAGGRRLRLQWLCAGAHIARAAVAAAALAQLVPRRRDMGKDRLEAFSDGVIAIIITIMVLELKVPHGADLAALRPLLRRCFLSYVLSFVYLGIYWNNHHHMLHTVGAGQRPDPVGEPAPAVLAVAGAVRHRLDGREPLRAAAGRALRRRAADGRRSPTTSCRTRDHAHARDATP